MISGTRVRGCAGKQYEQKQPESFAAKPVRKFQRDQNANRGTGPDTCMQTTLS